MRRSGFGEAYCTTADEIRSEIENKRPEWDVYLARVDPPEGDDKACGEICQNENGDLVCYVEADTEEAVRALVREVKIEDQS